MLINDGFVDEIVFCLKELLGDNCIEKFYAMHDGKPEITVKTGEMCSECGRLKVRKELTDYSGDDGYKEVLNRMMSLHKTNFAPLISDKIVSCGKDLPPLVIQLFDKIKEDLHICL